MLIHLCDINQAMTEAWKLAFADVANVTVSCSSIVESEADAIASPANSFGFMDGGIDLVYSRFFGWELESRLKKLIAEQYYGELPVGQAIIIPTEHEKTPLLISAPTMRVPSDITGTVNVYLAFRAVLIAVLEHNKISKHKIKSILVPGLGTGIGNVPPEQAAYQMRQAYDAILGEQATKPRSAREILVKHHQLLS